MTMRRAFLLAVPVLILGPLAQPASSQVNVDGRGIRIEFNNSLHSRVVATLGCEERVIGPYIPSERITVDGIDVADFALSGQDSASVQDDLGAGRTVTITGTTRTTTAEGRRCPTCGAGTSVSAWVI